MRSRYSAYVLKDYLLVTGMRPRARPPWVWPRSRRCRAGSAPGGAPRADRAGQRPGRVRRPDTASAAGARSACTRPADSPRSERWYYLDGEFAAPA